MKKAMKVIMVLVMLVGLAFTVINMASNDLKANEKNMWLDPDSMECYGPPATCSR